MAISVVAVLSNPDRYRLAPKRCKLSIAKLGNDLPKLRGWQRTPCAS